MNLKEKLFCYNYARLQNYKEAAIKSGYKEVEAEKEGVKLLNKKNIKREIEAILNDEKKRNSLKQRSILGLERLAFGSVTDVVKLMFAESLEDISNISELDLFNISEIKKAKGGGFEIKFFDRTKALEKLIEVSDISASDEETSFFEAIKKSAEAVKESCKMSEGDDLDE